MTEQLTSDIEYATFILFFHVIILLISQIKEYILTFISCQIH